MLQVMCLRQCIEEISEAEVLTLLLACLATHQSCNSEDMAVVMTRSDVVSDVRESAEVFSVLRRERDVADLMFSYFMLKYKSHC